MYSHVTEGAISQKNETGEIVLTQGQNNFIANPNMPAIPVTTLPSSVTEQLHTTPSPKTAPNPDKVYGATNEKVKVGSYVTVNKGSGKLESNSNKPNSTEKVEKDSDSSPAMALSEGESSFSGNITDSAVKLTESPVVITWDETLSSDTVNLSTSVTSLFPSNTSTNTTKVDPAACVVE
jgi:hypothetical protein